MQTTKELLEFIEMSPSPFHVVDNISKRLEKKGFIALQEGETWTLKRNHQYYVSRNGSSMIAFKIGEHLENYSFNMVASHSDSPVFKVKEHAEIQFKDRYTSLNTEGYGGMILSSWLDRPLSIAGRALVQVGDHFESKLVNIDQDLMVIPNVAIHMNRTINDGFKYNQQIDMMPLLAGGNFKEGDYTKLIAQSLNVDPLAICGLDMFVYHRTKPTLFGIHQEFIASPKLDDLQCAFATLLGFIDGENEHGINVYCCFDNEEVGSSTRQGAASTFLYDTLTRINQSLGFTQEDYHRALASSMMLSCDNAHAVHPNHPEKTDMTNHVYMNEGVVVKSHASQRYTSDGLSVGLIKHYAKEAGIPLQFFANRSDAPSGGTLGNISSTKVSVMSVDLGLPQLAMHSSYESAGVQDTEAMRTLLRVFFSHHLLMQGNRFFIQ